MIDIQTALADGTMKPERKRALDFTRSITATFPKFQMTVLVS